MPHALQQLVDDFADEIARTVTIDDKLWRVVAYSALHGDLDQLRLDALLHRDLPAPAKAWVEELRLAEATGPVRTPANPAVGAEPRVVVPIRHEAMLLGFLTLMDAGRTLTADELRATEDRAARAAELMLQDVLVEGRARGRERELVGDLLDADVARRRRAAARLEDEALLAPGAHRAVLVLRFDGASADRHSMDRRRALERGVEWLRRRSGPGGSLAGAGTTSARALISTPTEAAAYSLAAALRAAMEDASPGDVAAVGLSGAVVELGEAHRAAAQASAAATVAVRVARFGGVAAWDHLGAYALVSGVRSDLPLGLAPPMRRLLEHDTTGALITTLETYLDLAGDVKATAEQLTLHRAGVYYRLARIEEITGLAVRRDGEARLALHLGIKVARLDGLVR